MQRSLAKVAVVLLLLSQALSTPIKEDDPGKETPPKSETTPKEVPAKTEDARDGRSANSVDTTGQREQALLAKLNSKCSQRELSSCVMLKMVAYVNKLLKKSHIEVAEGVEISRTQSVVEEEVVELEEEARGDDGGDEGQISRLLANKLWAFVRSRSLRWAVFPEADVVLTAKADDDGSLDVGVNMRAAKAVELARKKNNNMGPLLAAGVMKLGLIGGVAFKALALLVGKALILSKIAFLLGAILWLKKLFSQQRHVTYEVVSHPHHTHSHVASESHVGHGHDAYVGSSSGWGRQLHASASGQDAHAVAYRAHVPTPNAPAPAPAHGAGAAAKA